MQRERFEGVSGFSVALRDGEMVEFRPVKRDDWQTIKNGMSDLSAKSRYFRFFSPIAQLSDAQLQYFTEIDQQDHVAWIALARDRVEHPGVAIARFIRFQNQADTAEFAVAVIDSYQKRGLGTMLMAVLYLRARARGIKILRGFVLSENTVAMRWFERLGAVGKFESGVYQMDIAVLDDSSSSPLLQCLADDLAQRCSQASAIDIDSLETKIGVVGRV